MLEEQKELYFFTKDHFEGELNLISPTCVSPIIAIRTVVKKAIDKYIEWYCGKNDNPFTQEDFQEVSERLYKELMNHE